MNTGETPLTIAALAARLAQESQSRVPPLVLLKAGSETPPIFMAHGLGDTVLGLAQLGANIQTPHPIYGMQARGIDGLEEPNDRIEDMAEFHLEAMRALQPHGPYILVGYSLGGLVMLEVARRLARDGEKIALLAMLDSYPDRHHLPLGQRIRLVSRRAKVRAADFVWRRDERRSAAGNDKAAAQPQLGATATRALQRMRDSQYRAWGSYRPGSYDGEIYFVKAAISTFFPDNPVAVWAHLTRQFEVETVPGNHAGMLTTNVASLASVLSRRLAGVPS